MRGAQPIAIEQGPPDVVLGGGEVTVQMPGTGAYAGINSTLGALAFRLSSVLFSKR
jgi:hypothetical protein